MEMLKPYILPFLICVVFSLAVSNHAILANDKAKKLRNLLIINSMVSFLGNLAFLIFYGIHTAWQYPVLLGIGGYIAGGILWAILNRLMGAKAQLVLSVPSMIGYPIAIFVCFSKLLITG